MTELNTFYIMNRHLIYTLCERSSVWTNNNAHMGYDFIVLGEVIDENTFDVINTYGVSGRVLWFNIVDMHLDKPTKNELNNFFNYIHTKEKNFATSFYELIEKDYPNILYKFPTLSQIRDKKISEFL